MPTLLIQHAAMLVTMDAERRENLAMQISRITHFDQLFVISHDDTFEGYVDNVISIGGSNSQG